MVSAYGLWDERVAYEAYKSGKINLRNPDKVLKEMLDEYYFNRTVEESNEKFKVLELKPTQSGNRQTLVVMLRGYLAKRFYKIYSYIG